MPSQSKKMQEILQEQEVFSRLKKSRRVLKPKFQWNPLKKLQRNEPCPCGSNLKFKKCCLNGLPDALPSEQADHIRAGGKFNLVKK